MLRYSALCYGMLYWPCLYLANTGTRCTSLLVGAGVQAAGGGADQGHCVQPVLDAHPAHQQPSTSAWSALGGAEAGHEP